MNEVALFFLLFMLAAGVAFGYTILQPMALAIRGKKLPTRFYISDFFSLSFLIAIPFAFLAANRHQEFQGRAGTTNFVFVCFAGVSVYVWWRGTTFLSGIGVLQAGRRCLFLGILLPIAIIGSTFAVPGLIVMVFIIVDRMPTVGVAIWLLCVAATAALAWCCRQATYWVLSDPNIPKRETPIEDHSF